MKTCSACGREYRGFTIKCPHCGFINYDPSIYPNKVAAGLARPVTIGTFMMPVTSLLWVITINLIIFACVGNAIIYGVTDSKAIWCQYVVSALFSMHLILHGFFSKPPHVMRNTRNVSFIAMATLLIQLIQANTEHDALILFMIFPVLILVVDLLGCVYLLTRKCSNFSYMITVAINAAINTTLVLVMNFAPVNAAVTTPQIVISYVSLGVSALLLANFVMLRVVSWVSKLRHGY